MKSKNENIQETLERDYSEIMKNFNPNDIPSTPVPQWTNPGDFIIKFSLYQETPNSITSTDTLVYPG
jgi:hypothetical protein